MGSTWVATGRDQPAIQGAGRGLSCRTGGEVESNLGVLGANRGDIKSQREMSQEPRKLLGGANKCAKGNCLA